MDQDVKTKYTSKEITELRRLIRLRTKTIGKSKQKLIRDQMRAIGFYGSAFHIYNCQEYHLDELIANGTIEITDAPEDIKKPVVRAPDVEPIVLTAECSDAEKKLIEGEFIPVESLSGAKIPSYPGLYCIKLREGVSLPEWLGDVRKDGIIYIGKAKDLNDRLWCEELNQKGAATFFRSIGAVLGYMPPKGSLYGKKSKNYAFCDEDTARIRKWMRESLLVNFILLDEEFHDTVEPALIKAYRPIINIKDNPTPSAALKVLRAKCKAYAKSNK